MTKERIEKMRESVLPFVKEKLVEINHEGLMRGDAEEIVNELLNIVIKALEQDNCTLDDAREDFVFDVYNILDFLPTNNEANRIIDVFDRVTTYIEQKPCEDAVSRTKAIDTIKHWFSDMLETGKEEYSIDDVLNSLPPVTPTRENTTWETKLHGFPPEPDKVCAKCGFSRELNIRIRGYDKIKYCPNCGRKFAENPTDSEMESEE